MALLPHGALRGALAGGPRSAQQRAAALPLLPLLAYGVRAWQADDAGGADVADHLDPRPAAVLLPSLPRGNGVAGREPADRPCDLRFELGLDPGRLARGARHLGVGEVEAGGAGVAADRLLRAHGL